jgi:hypothetical protein
MSFLDGCACHTLAIDGWTTEQRAKLVNDAYCSLAMQLMTANTSDLNAKVAKLVTDVRSNTKTCEAPIEIVLYGGFAHATDGAPMHMWFECGDWIYDTMPGMPFRRVKLSSQTRLQPPSEGAPFAQKAVGSCKAKMAVSQIMLVDEAAGHWYVDAAYRADVFNFVPS